MNTFLPYSDFNKCAEVLDMRRLGKQRVEAYQIILVLNNQTKGWKHHPAVLMWQGFERSLIEYGKSICQEWIRRGYKDSLLSKFIAYEKQYTENIPYWLGDETFHASHRSNLLRKDPKYYSQFNWSEPSTLPYVWPHGEMK